MTDTTTTTPTPDLKAKRSISRTLSMPKQGTGMGRCMHVLWDAAQRTDAPDCPWVTTEHIAQRTGIQSGSVAANLAQLAARGLVSKGYVRGRRAYALSDEGAVACAAVWGTIPAAPVPDAAA